MGDPEIVSSAFFDSFHAVMRNDLTVVLPSLVSSDDLPGFNEAWHDHLASVAVHAAMQHGLEGAALGSLAMLDHYLGGVVGPDRFASERALEHGARAAVTAAIAQGPWALGSSLARYQTMVEAHLALEEAVIVPLVPQLPPPSEPKFAHWCLAAGVAHGGFEHFVAHGVASLATHGSHRHSPAQATRRFLESLWSVCSPVHWTLLQPVVRAAAHGAIWETITAEKPELGLPIMA